MFVKLKDTGGIFHDASQDATVTGSMVVEVKKSEKVASAIKGGLLVEVPQDEAEKLIAIQKGEKVAAKNAGDSKDVKALKAVVETLTKEKEDAEKALETSQEELSTALADKQALEEEKTTLTTSVETLTKEKEALEAELATLKAPAKK